MPILELHDNDVDQQCSACQRVRRLPHADLEVGLQIAPGVFDLSIVALPVCSGCGAREFLMRTADEALPPPRVEGFPDRHRALVHALHAALVRAERVLQVRPAGPQTSTPPA